MYLRAQQFYQSAKLEWCRLLVPSRLTISFTRIQGNLLHPPGTAALQCNRHLLLRELARVHQILEQQLSRVFDHAANLDAILVEVRDSRYTAVVAHIMDIIGRNVGFHEIVLREIISSW